MEKTGITAVLLVSSQIERNLPRCLKSIDFLVEEIIAVCDNHPPKENLQALRKAKAKIFYRNLDSFCNQRNFALEKVTTLWVLAIDSDEEITSELAQEMKKAVKNDHYAGFWFPRKNMIFGKWIEHSGWYPDKQLHLFKKTQGKYVRQVHEQVAIEGEAGELKNHLLHHNYHSVSQYLAKIEKYSSLEANNQIEAGYKFSWPDLIKKPLNEFLRRFFAEEGYRDGVHGLALSLLQAFSELTAYLKIWEKQGFEPKEIPEVFKEINDGVSQINYWLNQKEKNPLKKVLRKISP